MTEAQSLSPGAPRRSQAQVSILVVDDEPAVRRYVRRVLDGEGYIVHEAADGVEAFDLVSSNPEQWHLVVTDIVMPRCNGVELHQRLATVASGVPTIFMSGYAAAQLADLGIVAPCGVLAKPFEPGQLLAEVRRCLTQGVPRD